VGHLEAIEAGEIERLPAVYARGYVRTYARYLGLDPEPLVSGIVAAPSQVQRSFGVAGRERRPRVVLSGPLAVIVGAAFVLSAFAFYAWRQIDSVNPSGGSSGQAAAHLPAVSPPTTPLPSPSPQRTPIVVAVRVTDTVWVSVTVDGQPQYSDAGKMLQPGGLVSFSGFDIKITSGKAAATFITVDGRPIGALGNGVVTREFKAT
jgi:cytoskeleton protein RodZ